MRKAYKLPKSLFTEGTKKNVFRHALPNHSSSVEMESIGPGQSSALTNLEFTLQQIHQLRPETSVVSAPYMVNHATQAQLTVNRPPNSIQYGAMDGNKTLPSAIGSETRKRYKMRIKSQVL